jgi:hypothetical protein
MNPETISALHNFTLDARELLEKEVSEQLEGIYGLLPDGRFEAAEKYPALKELEEARKTRVLLGQLLEDEKAVGLTFREARNEFVKESAFTWLNRLVAFKMMEARSIIRQSISKGTESNAFKLWLTQSGNEDDYRRYEQGDLPRNSVGEGPRDVAYRHFILWQCEQLAREIKVLFDPYTPSSRFFPRPAILKTMIEKMNDSNLQEVWAPGNEETIGWVYQSFNSEELEKAFREARITGKKFEAKDIPSVTQLFTPRWIVRFLVENTLGRLWVTMHPDSNLQQELCYFVPPESSEKASVRHVKGIRLLDPACGTMHFGLIAFDLFHYMYKEEIEHAGQACWPERPSVEMEEEIPSSIISHNLFGIDIDLRAVQLSALTLYLKAKTFNPKAVIKDSRLTTANVHILDGDRLDSLLQGIGQERPILKRVLMTLREKLRDSEQLGSLLRLEREIQTLIEKEKSLFEKEGLQTDIYGSNKERFGADAGSIDFWKRLGEDVTVSLNSFAAEQAKTGRDQTFFTGETEKGLRLLELLSISYDVVVTNPPYMSQRKMNSTLKALVSQNYPEEKGDLYAAFIRRCLELAGEHGRVGMLTMHSFMFISSYEKLRQWIRKGAIIETLAHLGPALFSVGNPGTLQTAAFILAHETEEKKRGVFVGTYFRLVKEPDSNSKRKRFEDALVKIKAGETDPLVYRYHQGDFDAIPGSPWAYWLSRDVRNLFIHNDALSTVSKRPNPGNTSYNFRFLRFYWEVRRSAFGVDKNWILYSKGGGFKKWYGNNRVVISWLPAVRDFYRKDSVARITDEEYWYRVAATYSSISTKGFSVRYFPPLGVYDRGGPALIFDSSEKVLPCLGILNSEFVAYLLKLINPTVNFQGGDLDRLPMPSPEKIKNSELATFVQECINLSIMNSAEDETTIDFISPLWEGSLKKSIIILGNRNEKLLALGQQIDDEVYRLYEIEGDEREAIEVELAEAVSREGDSEEPGEESGNDSGEAGGEGSQLTCEELARQWISYAVGIVVGRFEPGVENGLGRGQFSDEVAGKLRSLADADGILVMDEGHPDDLTDRVHKALAVMLGDSSAAEVVKAATEKEGPAEELLRQYLDRAFFKLHIQQYRKRPVYWFLQSPKKKYGVWVFHEKMTKDTLFRIKTEYLESKIKLLANQIADLQRRRDSAEGRERRQLEKEMVNLIEVLDDIREFLKRLEYIIKERGYAPHIDDGVLLNMAPLWELIPSWQTEPKKAWEELEKGEYDWAHQAMDYWPDRVREKCKTNRSYAIAHGIEADEESSEVEVKPEAGSRKQTLKKAKSAGSKALKKMGLL